MYQVGDVILYGSTGVCRIEEITDRKDPQGQIRPFYKIKPIYQQCVIYAPVEKCKVFTRPVISKEEAERLIDMMPTVKTEAYEGKHMRELVEHYESSINTHRCEDLIEMTKSIYMKRRAAIMNKRKFGAVDERFMKRAEDLLYGELAVALGIKRADVPAYIENRLKALETEEPEETTA